MSREILFRGKRIDNGEWVEGFYVKHGSRHWIYTGEMQYMYLPVCADLPTKYEVSAESVCQYTGLTDKNGRKIFEGDIVSVSHSRLKEGEDERDFMPEYEEYTRNYAVEFVNKSGHCGYRCRNKSIHFTLTQNTVYNHDINVIGNLWDNPELLNQ